MRVSDFHSFDTWSGFLILPWLTFPAALPEIPYVGFSPVRLQAPGTCKFGTKPSWLRSRLKSGPDNTPFAESVCSALRGRPGQLDSPLQSVGPLTAVDLTWALGSSLQLGYVVPTILAWRPHPPVWWPPSHFPAVPVIAIVFGIQGPSCLVTRPSGLSLLYSPGLPPSAYAGRFGMCSLQFFHTDTGHHEKVGTTWHLQRSRKSASCGDSHFGVLFVRSRYGPPGCLLPVLIRTDTVSPLPRLARLPRFGRFGRPKLLS